MSESVAISGESIKLGQFVKLANLVESGGQAKELIAEGEVGVNGEVETRRGRTLVPGDEVTIGGHSVLVSTGGEEPEYFDEATADDDFDPEKWRNM